MHDKLLSLSALIFLSGCGSTLSTEQKSYADNLTPCEKIQGLLNSFEKGFETLKAERIQNKYSDIWTPKYHVIGNSCQIVAFNNTHISYKCGEVYDQESQSRERFQWAVKTASTCLGTGWQRDETRQNESQRVTFHNKNHQAELTIQSGRTLAKYRKTWQTSFEIGDLIKTH